MSVKIQQLFAGTSIISGEVERLSPVGMFDADGTLLPKPAAFWEGITHEKKMIFGHEHALYSFPTVEGVEKIKTWIGGRSAIEIGAGNGAWCKALGIPGTDNYMQLWPEIKLMYSTHGQPVIKYGEHVDALEAMAAVAEYAPKVVVAAWVTHKFDSTRPQLKGNIWGVDEHAILAKVDEYIFIGNTQTHQLKPLFLDFEAGLIESHYVKDFAVGSSSFQSRASGGLDFVVRICRK